MFSIISSTSPLIAFIKFSLLSVKIATEYESGDKVIKLGPLTHILPVSII